MPAVPKTRMGSQTFLDWSRAAGGGRFELELGHVIELAAEQARHALAKHAITKAIEKAVDEAGAQCTVLPDGMTVVIDEDTVRLPDAAVQCTPVDPDSIVLDNPITVVEVVSPSSAARDESQKLAEYFMVPSLQHYLVLYPEKRRLIHFRRGASPGKIDTAIVTRGALLLEPPGISLSIDELIAESSH